MSAPSCAMLLEQYLAFRDGLLSHGAGLVEKLTFANVGNRDVYNITVPFMDEGTLILAGRVEERESEFSEVRFFANEAGSWKPANGYPSFALQDPFITFIHGELIFGGVRVVTDDAAPSRIISWVTEFYRGPSVRRLRHFFTGPNRMKDIRLVQLRDKRIGVLTRPQGEVGGRGQIGFTMMDRLEELSSVRLVDAPIFTNQFLSTEWGGSNETRLLSNGWIGVLGHIASFGTMGDKNYYPITFAVNPLTRESTPPKIVATRADFLPGPAKNPTLGNVVFAGGLVRRDDGLADLYAGTSDVEAQRLTITDPFVEYENLPDIMKH